MPNLARCLSSSTRSIYGGSILARESLSLGLSRAVMGLLLFCLCAGGLPGIAHAIVTPEQRKQIDEAGSEITVAGRLFAAGKFTESAQKLTEVQKNILKLMESKDPALLKLIRPQFSRLEKAHALLELEGVELQELPTWDVLTGDSNKPAGDKVSFTKDIAPVLLSQCGNCHVNAKRGQFSMASFDELMQGINGRKVVAPGGGKGSRIVEVIESGDMPRGGGKVSDADLAKLVKWIDSGAEFDGPDRVAPMASYAKPAGGGPAASSDDSPAVATGKETVKFSKDIAPLLLENCIGCHINARNPMGGLNMNNFTAMRRGGNSGRIIEPGKPDESLLIKKLKGQSGQRMPAGGRPALSDEKIALISTWIKENATFDGANPGMDIENVVSRAWAATASHSDLMNRRIERAKTLWNKVLPTSEPAVASNEELVVMGNISQGRAEEWLAAGQAAQTEVRKQLKIPAGNLVKGGIAIFIYKGRYDYSEFGRMNENRKLPNQWQGHWRASPLDVYVALVDDTTLDAKHQTGLLIQQLSGAYVGSLPQTPDWFAEGVARNVAIATATRGDVRIETWKRTLPAAAAMVDKSETLLEGRLDDEASGLVGMKLVGVMMDRRNRKQFDTLLSLMRDGKSFTDALTQTFAPPDKFVKSWIGK